MTRGRELRGRGGARQEKGEKIEAEVGVGIRVKKRACTNIRSFYDNRQDNINIRRLESARLCARRAYQFEDLK
jgi:hypothetical protein